MKSANLYNFVFYISVFQIKRLKVFCISNTNTVLNTWQLNLIFELQDTKYFQFEIQNTKYNYITNTVLKIKVFEIDVYEIDDLAWIFISYFRSERI